MKFTTHETPASRTPSPKATDTKRFRVERDENTGAQVTLAQVSANAEAGDVFGLTRPVGSDRKGFAMKRVLNADGTFGAVNGGDLSAEWADAQLGRLVYVGKRVQVSGKSAAKQQPKAKAQARAKRASKSTPKAHQERTPAQHAATLRMLEAKYPERAAAYAAKNNLTTVS